MLMEYAYLLVTDLHRKQGNLESRKNYQAECDHVFNKLIDCIIQHKGQGRKVVLLFLGDIFHNSYRDIFDGIGGSQEFIGLGRIVDGMYSVVGNHELTYYSDNPFWTLFSEIESLKVSGILTKAWKPQGKFNVLKIVDKLEHGNLVFHFNHHGLGITPITDVTSGKVNVGLFHQDLYAREIVQEVTLTKGLSIYEHSFVDITEGVALYGYDYAVFGHMHKLYGSWTYFCERTHYTTELLYLASLGRTNVTEVQDNFLERNIPSFIVKDNEFTGIEDFKFNLMSRDECVIEESVQLNRLKYEKQKEVRELITMSRLADSPLQNVRANLATSPRVLSMFDDLMLKPSTALETELVSLIEKVRYL